jgi:transcription termination factor Rho
MYDILELSKKLLPELKEIAKELNIKKAETLKKQDLIYKIVDQQAIDANEIKPDQNEEKLETKEELIFSPEVINNESAAEPVPEVEHETEEESEEESEAASALRRGKRPRTLKKVVKRSVESVMSVSLMI